LKLSGLLVRFHGAEEPTEHVMSRILYGLGAVILLMLKFAEGLPSLQRYLPIGGSFFYEVGVIYGPMVVIDQLIA
jgi:hypothetical protein